MRKFCLLMLITTFLLMLVLTNTYGYYLENQDTQLEFELEYFSPTNENARNIDTMSINILKEDYAGDFVSFFKGLTITHSEGDMFRRGEYDEVDVYGVGPTYLVRVRLLELNAAEISLDMSGAVIFWDKNFPQGDFYDFMWRIGPKLTCQIGENTLINIGYKLMHVSNGQWEWHDGNTYFEATDRNPSYNSRGLSLSIISYF